MKTTKRNGHQQEMPYTNISLNSHHGWYNPPYGEKKIGRNTWGSFKATPPWLYGTSLLVVFNYLLIFMFFFFFKFHVMLFKTY